MDRIKPQLEARVGLYSIGHPHYWNQFSGLLDRLLDYGRSIERRLGAWATVSNFGMVDSDEKARCAGEYFNQNNVDLLLCHAATYALSAGHIAVPQICRRPVVVLNLQPAVRMNYAKTATGEWLAQCVTCCVPEISNAFLRTGISFHVVSGLLGLAETPAVSVADENTNTHQDAVAAWQEIEAWIAAARVKRTLQRGRMGVLGHTYPGMLDLNSDYTMITGQAGMHVEVLEMCDLACQATRVMDRDRRAKFEQMEEMFVISEDSPSDPLARAPTPEQLDQACRVAAALEYLVREHDLDALTYYYRGGDGTEYQRLQEAFILGMSLLTAQGIPCSGEGDMKTAVAMKMCDTLGAGGSFSEIVATDYQDQTILMGHDGPFHIEIADSKPILRGMGLYHGKWGAGVSVEATVRKGPITNLGITQTAAGRLKMIVNQGEATQGEILRIGNTMTPVKFSKPPSQFLNEWFQLGPTHHFAMSVGRNAAVLKKLAELLEWPFESICL